MRADLHTHSYYSDGLLSPEDIVLAAKNNGVRLIALTDHDTMHGCAEFSKLAQANGLKSVNGVEVSAYYKQIKFHTLGYNIDKQKFQPFLNELFENSIKRTQEVVFKLNVTGIKITMEDVGSKTFPVHAYARNARRSRNGKKRLLQRRARFFQKLRRLRQTCVYSSLPSHARRNVRGNILCRRICGSRSPCAHSFKCGIA